MRKVFLAYPSRPSLKEIMRRVREFATHRQDLRITTWERPDISGGHLISDIVTIIKNSDIVVGDITALNFNVTYELGFALGLGKRVIPTRNSAYDLDEEAIQRIGLFDTLLRQPYTTAGELFDVISAASIDQRIATDFPPDPSPLYIVLPDAKTDDLSQIKERAQRAGLRSREFDPGENPRLGATEAIRAVSSARGVIIPLLSSEFREASIHNIRAAFVAGVAHALEKPTLIMSFGDWLVPLDVRDVVEAYRTTAQFTTMLTQFAGRVHQKMFSGTSSVRKSQNSLLDVDLGDTAAENEEPLLAEYFLERGEYRQVLDQRVNIVVGRKGSGKTAFFVRVRDQLRSDGSNVVVDLSPRAYQLKRLKDFVLDSLAAGSKEFLLSAFWEYVLLLEVAGKMIDRDRDVYMRNHKLFESYLKLQSLFESETSTVGIDFSDRLQLLIDRISANYQEYVGRTDRDRLSEATLTNILYKTTLGELKDAIIHYSRHKKGVYLIFDNLDKGWKASGLEDADIVIVRTLLDATRKMENDFRRYVDFHCTTFLRNDIYDILLSELSDRGKQTKVLVDWPHRDLLKQMVRRRLQYTLKDTNNTPVDALWYEICEAIVDGENSLDYLIRHSLMRPRYLLRLINHCIENAINFSREKATEEDILAGLSLYSTEIVAEIDLEIRDVLGPIGDLLYAFLGEPKRMKNGKIIDLLKTRITEGESVEAAYSLLIWHGVLGLKRRGSVDATYIYDVNYDMKRMKGLIYKEDNGDPFIEVNPALWAGLELTG